jgi:VWFA-related protein
LAIALLLAFTVLSSARQQAPPPTGASAPKISVDVNLVVLHATVYDQHGHFVSGLHEQDFHVYEDGVPQHITRFGHEDVPITAGLVVDHSGSMRRKIAEVSAAVRTFVQSSNPGDQMFVVNFNERVQLALPGFTNDPLKIEQAISSTPVAGETALYDAIVTALKQLKAGTLEKKILLVISDGGDNASTHTLAQVLKLAEQSSAIIYAVGIFDEYSTGNNPGVLRRLARSTGGLAFFPSDVKQISDICARIARDVRNQYMLAYVPNNPAAHGDCRAIRVTASAPHHGKLFVRTRTGYCIGGEPRAIP